MGKIWVREFVGGLDTRRLPETSRGGSLIRMIDCHVNNGGEIEQRAIFEKVYTAPEGKSVGIAATPDNLVIFGHTAGVPAGMPDYMAYSRLEHPSGEVLEGVPSVTNFGTQLASIGRFANGDRFIFVNSTRVTDVNAPPQLAGSGKPYALLAQNAKLNVGSGPNVFFSAIQDGDNFTGTGAGFIDNSFEIGDDAAVRALVRYDKNTAVFFQDNVLIWSFDADPDESVPVQTIPSTGTFSARAVVPFSSGDLLYLSKSGIRSLRARDSSRAAMTADIGSPIDDEVTAVYRQTTAATREYASGVVDPLSGRVWLALLDTIFIFSYFPAAKISAWSIYKPGFVVDGMAVFRDRVFLRSGRDVYVYGSAAGSMAYSDDVQCEAWLPYLDADEPSRAKRFKGIDAAVRGEWEVSAGITPTDSDAEEKIATIVETTFGHESIPYDSESTHISLRLRCRAAVSATAPAIFSSAVIHHDLDDDEDH